MFGRHDYMKEAMKRYADVIEKLDMTYYAGNGRWADDKPEYLEKFPVGQTALIFDWHDYATYENDLLAQSNLQAIHASFSDRMLVDYLDNRYFVVKVKSHRRKLASYDIAEDIVRSLDEYPVLDDDDHSMREWECWLEVMDNVWKYDVKFDGMTNEQIEGAIQFVMQHIEYGYYGCDYVNVEKQIFPLLLQHGLCYVDCWDFWTIDVPDLEIPTDAFKCAVDMNDGNFIITYAYFSHSEERPDDSGNFTKIYNVAIPTPYAIHKNTMVAVDEYNICNVTGDKDIE